MSIGIEVSLRCENEQCEDGEIVIGYSCRSPYCICQGYLCGFKTKPCPDCDGTGVKRCQAPRCNETASEVRQETEDGVLTTYLLCPADAEIWDFCEALKVPEAGCSTPPPLQAAD